MGKINIKGKVERFNLYLKRNFYIPLKASLKSSGITIDATLLNGHIFSWLEGANNRKNPHLIYLKLIFHTIQQ